MPLSPVRFEQFLQFSKFLYVSIGIEPYEKAYGDRRYYFLDFLFLVNIINMNFVLFSEMAFVFLAIYNGNHFLEATMNLAYIGSLFVADIKIWSIFLQKAQLTELIHDLREIYPHPKKEQSKLKLAKEKSLNDFEQREYGVESFYRRYKFSGFLFIMIHLVLIWAFNLFPAVNYWLYDAPRLLPYHCWVPWDWHGHWSYHLLYVSQNLAGHTCVMGQISSDLLLCMVVTQVILHYQYLAKRIATYETVESLNNVGGGDGGGVSYEQDMKFLKFIIEYHQRILRLTDVMNNVFGVSLLMNLMASAFIMCFLGFQMTIGVNATILVMLTIFLLCSLVQMYLLTNYGQELILASESNGHAVYNHEWFNGNLRYKKMLVLIIERSQKPAILKATTFLNVSLGTMTDLIQLSYKFYAVLRTIYSK